MKPVTIADRIIKSLEDFPDKWKLARNNNRLWANHEAGIDIALEGSYWVDIHWKEVIGLISMTSLP
jgi:hypothetical protein